MFISFNQYTFLFKNSIIQPLSGSSYIVSQHFFLQKTASFLCVAPLDTVVTLNYLDKQWTSLFNCSKWLVLLRWGQTQMFHSVQQLFSTDRIWNHNLFFGWSWRLHYLHDLNLERRVGTYKKKKKKKLGGGWRWKMKRQKGRKGGGSKRWMWIE